MAQRSPATPNNLRSLRLAAHLSQEGLARRADLSMMTIHRVENGRTPTLSTARKIAAALGVPLDEVFPELTP